MRNRNTSKRGGSWTQEEIDNVWSKGIVIAGHDPAIQRKDSCNAWIAYSEYGKTIENGMGWEIDHISPVSKGGTDSLSNLQPLQWENNRGKGDNYPNWECAKSAK